MTQVHVILPGYNTTVLNEEMLQPYQSSELQLSIRYVDMEVDAMRHEFDMALIAPGLIAEVLAAEKELDRSGDLEQNSGKIRAIPILLV